MQVFQQRIAQHLVITGFAHDRGNGAQARGGGGAQAPLPHDQLKWCIHHPATGARAHHDGLKYPKFLDGMGQFVEFLLTELSTGLLRVRGDLVKRNVSQRHTGNRAQVTRVSISKEDIDGALGIRRRGGNKRANALTQTASFCCH